MNVVITGGSRGLGFALAQRLLELDAKVTICGRSAASLARAAERLAPHGEPLTTLVCDVRLPDACDTLIRTAVERNGPIDILINNAGVIEVGPLENQTIDDFREAMDTHFWGPLYTMLAALPGMRKHERGHIVNISSVGGIVGVPHLAPYSASKFAQVGLTQAFAAEERAHGVTITSILPGLLLTGSPDNAVFKGRQHAEYAWFTLSDANPLLSTSVDVAVGRILRAIRRRESVVTIGWTAVGARFANAIFPQTTTQLLVLAARLLPAPGPNSARRRGAQSHSGWTDNPLTVLNARASDAMNQHPMVPPGDGSTSA